MPIYVWICPDCGIKIERLLFGKHTYVPEKICSVCGSAMDRVTTAAELRFEGEGWDTKQAKEKKDE